MKKLLPCLFVCFVQMAFQPTTMADSLYDVNFSSPPHTIDQSPAVGGGLPPRYTPSSIPSSFPGARIVQSEGALTNQPCKFKVNAGHWYAQMEFDLSPIQGSYSNIGFNTIYPRYIVEMDLLIEQVVGQFNEFTILFDTPQYRSISFMPSGIIRYDTVYENGIIGIFSFGQTLSLKVDINLSQSTWKIWVDGEQIHSGSFYSNKINDIRLSLGDRPNGGYGNLAAVDNIKVYGITEPVDLNRDNIVDMNDLSIIGEQWLQDYCRGWDGCSSADIDDSNQVDFADYAPLARKWLKTGNSAPLVDAGIDQAINYPALSVNLDGTVADDGQPDPPNTVTTKWSTKSGSGTVTFSDANVLNTMASFSQAGSYTLSLMANDGQLIVYDDVKIIINLAPVVETGPNQTIALPSTSTVLNGTVNDDGLPNPPGVVTTHWTQQNGPGTVTFEDANSLSTSATFSEFGTYIMRLTANDGLNSGYDEVTVRYFEIMPENQAPDVNAGNDEQIFEQMITLNGLVTDDGLPYPPGVVTTEWTQQSGPQTVYFENPNTLNTSVMFFESGVYVLRLTANDGDLSSYDEVTITFQWQ